MTGGISWALFYPPVDFSTPPVIGKAGDHAERKVIATLKAVDDFWHIFHAIDWLSISKDIVGRMAYLV